jgi:hypothetical protein
LPDDVEVVYGDFRVAARLKMGLEYLRVFVTDRRIIVAHIGKRGAGSQAAASIFGRLSAAIEDFFQSGKESVSKRGLQEEPTPERILAQDKDNFFVNYTDIVEVTFDRRFENPKLTVLTKDDKFLFIVPRDSDQTLGLLQKVLETKLRVL